MSFELAPSLVGFSPAGLPPASAGPAPGDAPSPRWLTQSQDDRSLAVLVHIGGFLAWFLVPLVVYLAKKEQSPFVADHAKEALNFQITITIYFVVGFLIFPVVMVFELIVVILACLAANRGEQYRYPLNIRFIR